ncbi:MAG: penicillin-binding transpeptidase domain-containing protein [Chlamydiota bacterium]|jgi:beta-lactamase class D
MRFLYLLIAIIPLWGIQHTFILHDVASEQFLISEGDISSRMSPYCTFNICLSLIGFDTGHLQDVETPVWPFKEEHRTWNSFFLTKWGASHHPKNWMENSCVWFSQKLTRQFGLQTLMDYVAAFDYGNQNLKGDLGKDNGLTHAWLGSSLRISPLEQMLFINKLIKQELPVSSRAYQHTKNILFREELPNGMALYGKTGAGDFAHGREENSLRVSWFVGWVEKENKIYSFVYRVHSDKENDISTMAREHLKQRLVELPL